MRVACELGKIEIEIDRTGTSNSNRICSGCKRTFLLGLEVLRNMGARIPVQITANATTVTSCSDKTGIDEISLLGGQDEKFYEQCLTFLGSQ